MDHRRLHGEPHLLSGRVGERWTDSMAVHCQFRIPPQVQPFTLVLNVAVTL